MDKILEHKDICELLNTIYARKNHDYGDSFSITYKKLGPISALTRISDKYERLISLLVYNKDRQVQDETIKDTLLDLANYCIMLYMEIDKIK